MTEQIVVMVLRPDTLADDGVRPDVVGIYLSTGEADEAIEQFIALGRILPDEEVWMVPIEPGEFVGSLLHHAEFGYAETFAGCSMWVNERGQSWVAALFEGIHTVLPAEELMVVSVR